MNTKKIAGLGLLSAVVIVLQALAVIIRPMGIFSISLVLVPIVVGASLYGWKAGAWLGLVFGVVVLINDAAAFLAISPIGTIITVLVKGVASGAAAGAIYRLIYKITAGEKNRIWPSTFAAAIVCPVVNTGIFVIGCHLFFMEAIEGWAAAAGYADAGSYIILGIVGVNFLIEMAINVVLSSAIVKIIKLRKS